MHSKIFINFWYAIAICWSLNSAQKLNYFNPKGLLGSHFHQFSKVLTFSDQSLLFFEEYNKFFDILTTQKIAFMYIFSNFFLSSFLNFWIYICKIFYDPEFIWFYIFADPDLSKSCTSLNSKMCDWGQNHTNAPSFKVWPSNMYG